MKAEFKYNEADLIGLLRKRSNIGFAYLYDNYSDALFGVIIDVINDREIAQDILQDVFMNIFRKIDTYDPAKSRLFTWMMVISRNLSMDTLKSKSYRNSLRNGKIVSILNYRSHSTIIEVDHIDLRSICMKLELKYWTVIELNYFQGYTHEDIAVYLGIPLGTVKTRIRSALLQLRAIMQSGGNLVIT